MKTRALRGPGEQSREQSADNRPNDAQQGRSDEAHVSVHDRASNQPDDKSDNN